MRNAIQRLRVVVAVASLMLGSWGIALAQYAVPVQGVVTNAAQQPLPGVAVSLVHPVLGRSTPSFTNEWGQYVLWNVPPHPAPYFMEVYWGQRLIYRQQLNVFRSEPVLWNVIIY